MADPFSDFRFVHSTHTLSNVHILLSMHEPTWHGTTHTRQTHEAPEERGKKEDERRQRKRRKRKRRQERERGQRNREKPEPTRTHNTPDTHDGAGRGMFTRSTTSQKATIKPLITPRLLFCPCSLLTTRPDVFLCIHEDKNTQRDTPHGAHDSLHDNTIDD